MPDPVLHTLSDGIASIRFNCPASLNTIDPVVAEALLDAVKRAVSSGARVIVLSGEGRAFCAGGNLQYLRKVAQDPKGIEALVNPMHDAVQALARAPQPVIASLHGAVAGAGMSLAMAADLAIAASDTVFSLAYAKIGATPDCSATWTLPRLVGLRRAMAIALLADSIDAAEAERLGLINRVVASENLAGETQLLAGRLAGAPRLAVAGIKRLLRESQGHTLSEQLESEKQSFIEVCHSQDFKEAVAAFFTRSSRRP